MNMFMAFQHSGWLVAGPSVFGHSADGHRAGRAAAEFEHRQRSAHLEASAKEIQQSFDGGFI